MCHFEGVLSEPPPSYNEAINDPPIPGNLPPSPARTPHYQRLPTGTGPYLPPYVSSSPTPNRIHPNGTLMHQRQLQSPVLLNMVYGNYRQLPFLYPHGYHCKKCMNTGYKDNYSKACSECWKLLFRERMEYNPNPRLPLRYPKRYLCHKCANTGFRLKDERQCSECWKLFFQGNHEYDPNPDLPFRYRKGYLCGKCFNTGYTAKHGRQCGDCWRLLFRIDYEYNPNPDLPFRYPGCYLCDKCFNTGNRCKDGEPCLDCYERFSPHNNSAMVNSGACIPPGVFTTVAVPGVYGIRTIGSPGGVRVLSGDPRLGGVFCGRCRGAGLVMFFLDQDLCPVCAGLGRIVDMPLENR